MLLSIGATSQRSHEPPRDRAAGFPPSHRGPQPAIRDRKALDALGGAGILRQRNVGRQRYRVFEAADVLDLFTGLERALASPTGDTATDPPATCRHDHDVEAAI